MNGDDMSQKILNQSGKICLDALEIDKAKRDFDEISSIYGAAQIQNSEIELTWRKIQKRDIVLSQMDD